MPIIPWVVTSHFAVMDYVTRWNLSETVFILAHSSKNYIPSWIMTGKPWWQDQEARSCCTHSQKAESEQKVELAYRPILSSIASTFFLQQGSTSKYPTTFPNGTSSSRRLSRHIRPWRRFHIKAYQSYILDMVSQIIRTFSSIILTIIVTKKSRE